MSARDRAMFVIDATHKRRGRYSSIEVDALEGLVRERDEAQREVAKLQARDEASTRTIEAQRLELESLRAEAARR